MKVIVYTHERAVVHVDGKPVMWLGAGRHRIFAPFKKVEVVRVGVDRLVADLRPEQAALAPPDELETVLVQSHERALVWLAGKPAQWLAPGRHYVFTVDPGVEIQLLDTRDVAAAPLDPNVRKLVPASDYVEATVAEGMVALRFVDGVLDAVLPAGRHAAWTTQRAVTFAVLDGRERVLTLAGQEVMTKDRVTLRLNISLVVHMVDAKQLATVAQKADEILYLAVQLAARDAVTGRTLDGLLAARDALATELRDAVAPKAREMGMELDALGIKDIVLPGEMKDLLNKVIEAQKAAEANVIMRREETAATRSLAQTAQLLAEQPLLLRLKELEAYKDLAAKVGAVNLFLGRDELPKLVMTK